MPSRELPARPNLEQLKNQAKSLLDAARAGDRDALGRFAVLPSLAGRSPDAIAAPAWPCTMRSRRSRASTDFRRGTRCARKSSRAACRSTRRSTNSSAVPRGGATGRAERLLALHPRLAIGDAADGAGARRCGGSRGSRFDSQPELAHAAGRTAELGAAALRVPHLRCTRAIRRGWMASWPSPAACCALGANPNAEYHWNWHPGAAANGAVGARSARSDTCRSPRCCSKQAPIRPTASRRTSLGAAAISRPSNCCIATA